MASLLEKLAVLSQFIKTLTWRKLMQFAVFLAIIAISWAGFENRESIYGYLSQDKISISKTKITTLSEPTRKEIDRYVYGSSLVVGIQIHVVDFQKNSKFIVYTGTDVQELRLAWQQFFEDSLSVLPLFNTDAINNSNIIDLINGDIICAPYSETTTSKLIPSSTKYIHTVCMSSIPPFYGKFAGIINVHLKQEPSSIELDQIKTMSKILSTTIYDRDFK
jgi:hypothetical protein